MESEVERVVDEPRELEAEPTGAPQAIQTTTVEPAEDPEEPEAVELKPGERFVPLSAHIALRNEIKALKPQAKKAAELEAWVAEKKPYVGFVENNWQALTNPQPVQPPHVQQPAAAAADPALEKRAEQLAKRLDLYKADGTLNIDAAKEVIAEQRQAAREEAEQAMEPLITQTHTQQAQDNYATLLSAKDHAGRPLDKVVVDSVVGMITSQLPRAQAAKVLADKQVTNLLLSVARDTQMQQKGPGVQAPTAPPLVTERAGGGTAIVLSEAERRVARAAGLSESQYAERAKKANPNSYVDLE